MLQRSIASGRFALPAAVAVGALAWLLDGLRDMEASQWTLPEALSGRPQLVLLGLLPWACAVYSVTELNNTFVLLRAGSRAIGSLLALLAAAATFLHPLQPGLAVLLLAATAYFPLFRSYQDDRATEDAFLVHLLLGCGALLFPRLLAAVPVFWLSQALLRGMGVRCFLASLLGTLAPLWAFAALAFVLGHTALLLEGWTQLATWQPPCYAALTGRQAFIALLALAVFLLGAANYLHTRHLDKTRTRAYYSVILLQGAFAFLFLAAQPQHCNEILPLCLVNAALAGARFAALSAGRIQNCAVAVLALVLIAACLVP